MPSEGDRLCPRCGQLIPAEQTECPVCTKPRGFLWSLERETLVLVSFLMLAVFFGITGFVVQRYHASQQALGGRWYQRGEAALKANHPEEAAEYFHTALVYSRDNDIYQMRLAEALVEANRLAEARVYLQSLLERQPGSGQVNLELARLSAKSHDITDALRYYHTAVFGAWIDNPGEHRLEVRIELCRFLLENNLNNEAEAEIIALQTELPPDARLHAEVGGMFMRVGDYRRALGEYQRALRLNSRQPGAWSGAGEAAFQLGDYLAARRYLQRAVEENPKDTEAAEKLEISRLAVEFDPFERRLSERERSLRAIAAFHQALSRLKHCAQSRGISLQAQQSAGPFSDIYSQAIKIQPKVSLTNLRRNSDLVSGVMDLVLQMEETAQQACGTPPPVDQALLLVSRTRGNTEQ